VVVRATGEAHSDPDTVRSDETCDGWLPYIQRSSRVWGVGGLQQQVHVRLSQPFRPSASGRSRSLVSWSMQRH
jgi:hypothetical protein